MLLVFFNASVEYMCVVKGNESYVEDFNFEISTPLSGNSKMLHLNANPLESDI